MSIKNILLSVLLIIGLLANGQERPNFNPDSTFFKARELAFSGQRSQARDSLEKILKIYPEYLDVELLMAKTYSWDTDYDVARALFNKLTSKEKYNHELWLATVKNELYAKRYGLALGLANKALKYFPKDETILSLKKNAAKKVEGKHEIYEVLKKENSSQAVKNGIALRSEIQVFDQFFESFYTTTLEYQRNTTFGAILPRINYSERFNIKGTQFELDVYPKFSKKLHGYLNYGYSDDIIFPRHRAGAELFLQLPLAMETSLGIRYLDFEASSATIYTGSFGVYTGNYYFSARPFLAHSEGDWGFSASLLARKYLKNAQNFLGANLSYGINAESNQFFNGDILLAESLIYLSSLQVQLSYQFTGKLNQGSLQTSLNLSRQEVPFSANEFVHSATIGIQYKFNF